MHVRATLTVLGSLVLLSGMTAGASAQNAAPFTITFPPDGATVREKVAIRVPLASIPEGAYVAFSIDGQFRVALAPTDEQREKAGPGDKFEYVWDTKEVVKIQRSNKEEAPSDGRHQLAATLYIPKSGSAGGATAAETSSVNVTLENKITTDPGSISLRYRYQDGSNRTYNRTGTTAIVGGVTQGLAATGDVELIGQSSDLLLAVEDVYSSGNAIVRNRLTRLAIKQGGQETVYPQDYLPKSIYQEVDPLGVVHYPPQDRPTGDEFWQMGIPISATLDLPIMPRGQVRVGDVWDTPGVVLDIPGTAPDKQPKVTVKSTLAGLEWESGHQTARIVQSYDGPSKEKSLVFGNMVVDNPQIKFNRVVYLAYRSGALVKIDRTLEVSGTTTEGVSPAMGGMGMSAPGAPSAGGISAPGSSMMGPGMGAPPMMGGMSGPPMMGGAGRGGSGMPFMGPGGLAGGPSGMGEGREGPGGRGMPRMGRGGSSMGLSGPPMMSGGGMMRNPYRGYAGGMGTGPTMGQGQATAKQKITLRSKTTTELKPAEPAKKGNGARE